MGLHAFRPGVVSSVERESVDTYLDKAEIMIRWRMGGGHRLVYGLAALALVQVLILVLGRGGLAAGSPDFGPGYDFGDVEVSDGASSSTLATGQPTLVLVFHSGCAHCMAVAPLWAEWLSDRPAGLETVAVSREPHSAAAAYARRHGWDVDVRSVRVPTVGSRARALVAMTPWVYALDGDGAVVAGFHGSEIGRAAAALRADTSP